MTEQMDCQKYRAHLDEWLDGTLSEDLVSAMEAHRNSCPDCAAETEQAKAVLDMLHSLDAEVPVPLKTQAAWRSAVRAEAKQRTRFAWSRGMRSAVSAAAAFVALVGCTVGFRSAGVLDAAAPVSDAGIMLLSESADAVPVESNYVMNTGSARSTALRSAAYTYIASDGAAEDSAEESEDTGLIGRSVAEEEADSMLIRRVERTISTENFDAAAQNIRDLTEQFGGYLEKDATAVQNDGLHFSEFISVIPRMEADSFLQTLDHIGNVTYTAEYFDDASVTVHDVSSQLQALRLENERLQTLISEAESAEEIARLNAQFQSALQAIDTLESESNRLNSELQNVRVSVRLEELSLLHTAEPTLEPNLSQRMSAAFASSAHNLKSFVHDMLVSLMVIAPFGLTIGAAALLIAAFIWLMHRRK